MMFQHFSYSLFPAGKYMYNEKQKRNKNSRNNTFFIFISFLFFIMHKTFTFLVSISLSPLLTFSFFLRQQLHKNCNPHSLVRNIVGKKYKKMRKIVGIIQYCCCCSATITFEKSTQYYRSSRGGSYQRQNMLYSLKKKKTNELKWRKSITISPMCSCSEDESELKN